MRNFKHILQPSTFAIMAAAFDPGSPGWKLTADGKAIELKDGNPIWVGADGQEAVLSGDTISRLNSEAATLRKAKETAETALGAFKDIKDPKAAMEAVAMLAKIDQKKLIDAGEVDKVTAQITAQFTERETALKSENAKLADNLNSMKIGNIFANSEFVRDQIAIPRDMFQDSFSKRFKINEKGDIEAFDAAGNPLMSKAKIGDRASPEEALQLLVDMHPQKDTILKPVGKPGSGGNGNGGARGGGNVMKRAAYDQLSQTDQQAAGMRAAKGELQIVD